MKRTLICLVVAAVLLTAAAMPVSAFVYRGKSWCCKDINFCINPIEFDTLCNQPGPGADFVSQVLAAAATWNAQGTSFQLINSGLTTREGCTPTAAGVCGPFSDSMNTISVAKTCPLGLGVLASTWIWSTGSGGGQDDCCVTEADICFSNDYSWYESPDTLGCAGNTCYDVQSVALHEFGHWIVLDHEDDPAAGTPLPVMQTFLGPCEIRRMLQPDDIAGLNYVYDPVGHIDLPFRCDTLHSHPPYPQSPKTAYLADCPTQQCGCITGKPFCDSTTNDPCLVICPKDEILFKVTVKDQCGNPVCDPNCWLDLTNCLGQTIPCPTESFYPIIYPDSCDPATGIHYFYVGAGLRFCETPCLADIYVDGSTAVRCRPRGWIRTAICA